MTEIVRFLEESRQAWRRQALRFESERQSLLIPGDTIELVQDDAGDLFFVTYGVHLYPVAIEVIRCQLDSCWMEHVLRIDGDVRTTRRPARPE